MNIMEATKEKKIPDPKLKENPPSNLNVFVLKFPTEEDQKRAIEVLNIARISRFGSRIVSNESWDLVGRDAVLELKKHKELNYEVW